MRRIVGQMSARSLGIALLFALDALVINLFGQEFFGYLVFYMAAAQIAAMVGALGQNNYVVFLLERYRHRKDGSAGLEAALFSVFIAAIGGFVAGLLLAAVGILVSEQLVFEPLLLAMTSLSLAIFEVLRQFFRVIERELVSEILLLVVQPAILITIVLITWALYSDPRAHTAAIAAIMYLTSSGVAMAGLVLFVCIFKPGLPRNRERHTRPAALTYQRKRKRYLLWLRQGTPLVFSGLFTSFQQRMDVFVLGFFVTPSLLAIYQVLSRISLVGLFVLRSVQSVFLARFARHVIRGERFEGERIHIFSTIVSVAGVAATFAGSLLFDPVFELAFQVRIMDHIQIFLLLFLARFALASAGGAPLFLQMTRKRAQLALYFCISAITFFAPYFISIAVNGSVGPSSSAIALLLFNATYAALCFAALRTYLRLGT